jgi:hypothetical protein
VVASPMVVVGMLACAALGFALAWTLKPQKKEVAGSVRGAKGRFVKRV